MDETSAKAQRKGTELSKTRRTEDRLERQHLANVALLRFIEKLGTSPDVSTIADLLLTTFVEQLAVKRVLLYFAIPERGRLAHYRSIGVSNAEPLSFFDIDSPIVRWLRESEGPVHLDEFFAAFGEGAHDEEETMRQCVDLGLSYAMPLAVHGDFLGMLLYGGSEVADAVAQGDAEVVKMLGAVASLALKHALLYRAAVTSNEEREEFAQVRREFISHNSHELRTAVTVLKSTLWSLEPEEASGTVLVDMAKDALVRLEGKVEHFLMLSDIELNEADSKLHATEISSLIEDVLREMIAELEEKQVRVTVDDRAQDRKVLVDPSKIAMVIRSILEVSMTLVDRGRNITIAMRVSESPPGNGEGLEIGLRRERPGRSQTLRKAPWYIISVKDDGIGIPEGEMEAIADPLAMESASQNGTIRRLGIGLAVSEKVVAGHGGKIFFRSDLGQGSQFSIWLPLHV